MNTTNQNKLFEMVADDLDIPESAYEKADSRYKSLYEWLTRDGGPCSNLSPYVYPQGSFRLGTVVRPLHEQQEYDLDMGMRMRSGISKSTHTQEQLKALVGSDLEAYRVANGIKELLDEKTRCWRLSYADQLRFHLDAVPSIREETTARQNLQEAMVKFGSAKAPLAADVAHHAGSITDKTELNYKKITPYWRVSNSEGYALWFESKMRLATLLLEKRASLLKRAKIEEMPAREWKSPLQQVIRILKRHRDVMFQHNPDSAPISIIITTLAATAYAGQDSILGALEHVLQNMKFYVHEDKPRVPNPVNPGNEDFAEKWDNPEYRDLDLENSFNLWIERANADFNLIVTSDDPDAISRQLRLKFGVTIGAERIRTSLGLGQPSVSVAPRVVTLTETPPKPWSDQTDC